MPQIQVLQRQPDQNAEAISNAGKSIADSITQQQLLKLEVLKMRHEMAQTDNERKKAEIENNIKQFEVFQKASPIIQQLPEDQRVSALHRLLGGDEHQTTRFLDNVGKVLTIPPNPEDALKQAQTLQYQAEARKANL